MATKKLGTNQQLHELFKRVFTKYLNYLELSEKLQDKTEKRTAMKI